MERARHLDSISAGNVGAWSFYDADGQLLHQTFCRCNPFNVRPFPVKSADGPRAFVILPRPSGGDVLYLTFTGAGAGPAVDEQRLAALVNAIAVE